MADGKPLTSTQHRAAALLGQGRTQEETAAECGTTGTTVRRWLKRDDFTAEVKVARDAAIDANPSARSVLESALHANTPRGLPDWRTRLDAAKILFLDSGDEGEGKGQRSTRIFMPPDEDDGAARPDPLTKPD